MIRSLSIVLEAVPPTEFRIFTSGVVDTVKGQFLFDDAAAQSVMAEYTTHGIDLMIDYDHASLSAEHAIDPALAGKAAGWFNIAIRNGELWAVNVRWSLPATKALQNKEWRFMSPAFSTDDEGRVTSLLNVALTNLPASRRLTPLVAASLTKGTGMDPDLIKKALDAIQAGDPEVAIELLKSLIADAAGASPDADGDADGSEGDGAEGAPAEAAVEDPKVVDASDAPPPPPAKGDDDDSKPAAKKAMSALTSMFLRMTGTSSFAEALSQVQVFKASHLTLEAERVKLAKERAALESAERRQLCIELVKCGAEFPSTIWADDRAKTPKARWQKMPIAELRAHVADQKAARSAKGAKPAGVKPAQAGGSPDVAALGLTDEELAICASMKCDPKTFASLKGYRDTSHSEYLRTQRALEMNALAQAGGTKDGN